MVRETAYYDLLGVQPNATEAEIKRAYYREARKVHPDKNPDDPTAHSKFQELGAAYQILSDPAKREAYNRLGAAGVSDVPLMDPGALFSVLFGSDVFEDYVGQLQMATAASIAAEAQGGQQLTKEQLQARMAEAQKEREAKLVPLLRDRLAHHAALGREAFETRMREEANGLSKYNFGPEMLQTIGYIYSRQGAKELGRNFKTLGVGWAWEAMRGVGHGTKTTFSAVSGIVGLQQAAMEMQKQMQAGQLSPQQAEAMMAQHAEQLLSNMWKVNVADIEGTLGRVCTAVLQEPGLSGSQKDERARALKRMGKVFQEVSMRARELRGPHRVLSKVFGRTAEEPRQQSFVQPPPQAAGYPPQSGAAGAAAAGAAAAGAAGAAAGARVPQGPPPAGYAAPPPPYYQQPGAAGYPPQYQQPGAAGYPPPHYQQAGPAGYPPPYQQASAAGHAAPPGQQQPEPQGFLGKLGRAASNVGRDVADLGTDIAQRLGLADPTPQPGYYVPAGTPVYAAPGTTAPPPYYYHHQPPAGAAPATGVPVAPAAGHAAAPVPPAGAAPAAAQQQPDFDNMSISELKRYIGSRGATLEGAIEKRDLVAIAKALN